MKKIISLYRTTFSIPFSTILLFLGWGLFARIYFSHASNLCLPLLFLFVPATFLMGIGVGAEVGRLKNDPVDKMILKARRLQEKIVEGII